MYFFKIKLTPVDDKNKGDEIEINYNEEMFAKFIQDRKMVLNDIIYPDKVKFINTKINYNKAWDKVIKLIKDTGKLSMKKCEAILAEGTEEIKLQLAESEQKRIESEQKRIKLEQRYELERQSMLQRISKLESLIKSK